MQGRLRAPLCRVMSPPDAETCAVRALPVAGRQAQPGRLRPRRRRPRPGRYRRADGIRAVRRLRARLPARGPQPRLPAVAARRRRGRLTAENCPRSAAEPRYRGFAVVVTIDSGGHKLRGHLARPPDSAATEVGRLGLVLCHGFPSGPRGALTSAETYPELANKLASEAGWVVLTFNFRGTGESEGEFSLEGWMADLRAAIDHLFDVEGVAGVWLAGFSAGGALAICVAGEDERIGGVAALAAPGDFGDWA